MLIEYYFQKTTQAYYDQSVIPKDFKIYLKMLNLYSKNGNI